MFTSIFCGVGRALCVVMCVMLRLLHMVFIVSICSMVPMLLCQWCTTQRILIASVKLSMHGSLSFGGLVGSSYLVIYVGI